MKSQPAPAFSETRLLRTGIWYGDEALDLRYPTNWDVETLWPPCGVALGQAEMAEALEHPAGQPPIREMCRGAKRPLIIIDDVNRPTPVSAVLPLVLGHLKQAGIAPRDVTILLATGAHAAAQERSIIQKVGAGTAAQCTVLAHDSRGPVARFGRTTFGTPVVANRAVNASDFVLGIGGIYPNYTAGYGGGSKLALGVLGFKSILCLHYYHRPAGRSGKDTSSFRKDLDEIAKMLRIRTMITLHIDADRRPIRVRCGDYLSYHREEAEFARRSFAARVPGAADIVIANAYPVDLTLTFALMKGAAPLQAAKPGASRILIASCPEGVGGHGLFPNVLRPRLHRVKTYLRFAAARPGACANRLRSGLLRRCAGLLAGRGASTGASGRNPIWVYTGPKALEAGLPNVPGIRCTDSWAEILDAVEREQRGLERPSVALYACAPLVSFPASQDRHHVARGK